MGEKARLPVGCENVRPALEGHLDVLKWARKHGCPWELSQYGGVCENAAMCGHLEVLKWAREHGCEWYFLGTCINAAKCGNLEVLKWARENSDGWKHGVEDAVRGWAAHHVHMAQGEFAHFRSSSNTDAYTDILRWLDEYVGNP